jgi:rubrerythrin
MKELKHNRKLRVNKFCYVCGYTWRDNEESECPNCGSADIHDITPGYKKELKKKK